MKGIHESHPYHELGGLTPFEKEAEKQNLFIRCSFSLKRIIFNGMKLELPEFRFCPLCGASVELQNKEGRNRPICATCGHIIYVNPIPAAALVVFDGEKVLLTLRDVEPHKGEWCLPGGFIEWGESPEEGARRELFEETGITAGDLSLVGAYSSISGTRRHVLLVAYKALSWTGEAFAGDDASEVRWYNLNEIPPLAFRVHEQALADSRVRMV